MFTVKEIAQESELSAIQFDLIQAASTDMIGIIDPLPFAGHGFHTSLTFRCCSAKEVIRARVAR